MTDRETAGWGRAVSDEEGSGSVLGVALLVLLTTAVLAVLPVGRLLAARQTVIGAADAAALAAADVASGRLPGVPCEKAALVAAALDATLDACAFDGGIATISVSSAVAGLPLRASARAGPPP